MIQNQDQINLPYRRDSSCVDGSPEVKTAPFLALFLDSIRISD
jgi:hypothetical protein